MRRAPQPPHPDTLEAALDHYNDRFRRRYRLPPTSKAALQSLSEQPEWNERIEIARADGVADPTCALIARAVLSIVDRYTIGFVDGSGKISDFAFGPVDEALYRGHHVLLVNPLGGRNNWAAASRWFRQYGGEKARRTELAGLASEKRRDEAAIWDLLTRAKAEHGRAVILPPDEGFSGPRAAEVAFIYGVSPETLRSWKRTYRSELSGRKPGAPRKNR
jgi:hypothetical protein